MDPTENDNDKISPEPRRYSLATFFALFIISVQILVSVITYPFLPDVVPTHWNAAGQVDGYAPKWVNAILFPAISISLYVLVRGLVALGPRLGQQHKRTNPELVNLILVGILLFELVIQLAVTAASFRLPVDITFVVSLFISALFMFMGNYLGKLRRNFWAGIRTPWTLVSDVVWERTHRLGGWLFVLAGFLGIIMSFVPPLRIWGVVGVLLVVVVILVVYSYLFYQQVEAAGGKSLSPPFDQGS